MQADTKRFNISVSPELYEQLSDLKEEKYPHSSRNEMLTDPIRKGLESVEEEQEK